MVTIDLGSITHGYLEKGNDLDKNQELSVLLYVFLMKPCVYGVAKAIVVNK
jgi:hypothetical protein